MRRGIREFSLVKMAKVQLSVLLFAASGGCVIALAVLAWLPAKDVSRTVLGGRAEHLIAYLGTTILTGFAFQKRLRPGFQCALLVTYAAALEAGQQYSPDRHASVGDFAYSAAGVVVGGLLLWIARSRMVDSDRTSS